MEGRSCQDIRANDRGAQEAIAFEDRQFTLDGVGPAVAEDVLEYDRPGHLVWVI